MMPRVLRHSLVLVLTLVSVSGCSVVCMMKPHHHRSEPDVSVAQFTPVQSSHFASAYRIGNGPPVLLLHELPGPTPQLLDLARRLSRDFTVYVPVLFGDPGRRLSGATLLARCMSSDYHCLKQELSPVSVRVRGFAEEVHARHPGQKMGAIGMCLTGNVPLALAGKTYFAAAVLSQPALPLAIGVLTRRTGLTRQERENVIASRVPILALAFTRDCISPPPRLDAYGNQFPGQLTALPVPSDSSRHHAVLTDSLDTVEAQRALDSVRAFLRKHLLE